MNTFIKNIGTFVFTVFLGIAPFHFSAFAQENSIEELTAIAADEQTPVEKRLKALGDLRKKAGDDAVKGSISTLIQLITHQNPHIQEEALLTIREFRRFPEVIKGIPIAISLLDNKPTAVMIRAIEYVTLVRTQHNAQECLKALPKYNELLVKDPRPEIREEIGWALFVMIKDASGSVSEVTQCLDDKKSAEARWRCARILKALGKTAQAALPKLEELKKNDPEERVRKMASEAIEEISKDRTN